MAQYLSLNESRVLTMILKHIRPSEHDKAGTLLQTIASMSNVRDFSLCTSRLWPQISPRLRDLEYLLRTVVTTGCATFGSTLRSLTLDLSLEGYHYALTPTVVFPGLEALDITLSESSHTGDGRTLLRDVLIPFINIHHGTLQSLKLDLSTFDKTDVSSCLLKICHLPHLQKLDYYHGLISSHNINTLGLQHILETHSNGLRELSLGFDFPFPGISSTGWYAQECFRVALPHLQSLRLGSGCWWDLGLTAAWLQKFEESLTRLVLDRWRFTFHEVETIVNVFRRRGLHSLYLSVHHMTPELVDMLERTLPGLVFLQLRFAGVQAYESGPQRWNEGKLVIS
jgi:hypothetical protein